MLASAKTIEVVASCLQRHHVTRIVVDPVGTGGLEDFLSLF
jgi:hydroxymethylpyrimidine/phosphomethylpyrimidine kinase